MTRLKTCGNCPHVRINDMGRMGAIAYCSKTDNELIVPHQFDGMSIIYTRVPDFCTNPDTVPSTKPAPKKEWVKVTVR